MGDERNFVRIRVAEDGKNSGQVAPDYNKLVAANIGDTIQVSVAAFNDAADNLGSAGTIHGLTAQLQPIPQGTELPIEAHLAGKNVDTVWDGAEVVTTEPAKLVYVEGSGRFKNVYGESTVPDTFGLGDAQLLGSHLLDGEFVVGTAGPEKLELGGGYLDFDLKVIAE